MKQMILTLTVALIFSTTLTAQNVGDSPQTKLGFTKRVESKVLNDSLNIYIHLPFNYKKDKEFPLIVLLDAHSSFKAFSACTELMAYARSIPTCIVVGFPQYKYANFNVNNINDKMDNITRFMGKELLPQLKTEFNITKTLIWGQGTEITTYLMLNSPDMFDGYIADVPDLKLISEMVNSKEVLSNLKDHNVDYYIFGSSVAKIDNNKFVDNLRSNAPKELNWHYYMSDESDMIIYLMNNYMHAIKQFFAEQ